MRFSTRFPGKLEEYAGLLTKNQIWLKRTKGVGVLSQEDTIGYGLVGPLARAVGVNYDVRRAFPYSGYDTYEFDVPVADGRRRLRPLHGPRRGDAPERPDLQAGARSASRREVMFDIQDYRIVPPPKDKVYTEMEALIQHFLIYSQGFTVPPANATCRSKARAASTASASCRTGPIVPSG